MDLFWLQLALEKEELIHALSSELSQNSKLKVLLNCIKLYFMRLALVFQVVNNLF